MKRLALVPFAVVLSAMVQDGSPLLEPGQWEITIHMTEVEVPGVPAAMVEELRSTLPPPKKQRRCMSPEEAADPVAFLAESGEGSNCTVPRALVADGRIDLAVHCPEAEGARTEITLNGTFTRTTMDTALHSSRTGANPTFVLRGTMAARRIGSCS